MIADDITPEEAASLLAQQGGRLAILSAEGGIFATLAGRYSGAPNLDVFLKGHSCDLLRIDRRGRPSEWVKKPAVTVGLTVQPAIIDELSRTALFRGTGLLARFLYSLPENTIGSRQADPPAVPEDVAAGYDRHLRGLVHTLADWTDPAVLLFTPDANQVLIDLHNEIEPKMHPTRGEWAHIGDWAGKHVGHVGRIAALLHAAGHPEDPWQHNVTNDTVSNARRLGDYFAAHALAVFDRLSGGPALDGARVLLDWIERTGMTGFTKRDAHRANRTAARFQKVSDLDPALAVLEEHGHIQQVDEPPRAGRGRKPSPRYLTHPQYHEQERGQN